jgi:hypothetical protein
VANVHAAGRVESLIDIWVGSCSFSSANFWDEKLYLFAEILVPGNTVFVGAFWILNNGNELDIF